MKLDIKLLRKVLEVYESLPYGGDANPIKIEGFSEDQINAHQELLMDDGFIKAEKNVWIDGNVEIWPESITLKGHKLLKDLSNDTIWKKIQTALESLGPIALKAGFEAVLELLKTGP